MVLFPEGVLSLKVFETRYLDMVSMCLKQDLPFGICMITVGQEVGEAAQIYEVGTLAKIINWDQADDGVLMIEVLGCQRFKIIDSRVEANELTTATIQLLEETLPETMPEGLVNLTHILRRAIVKREPKAVLNEALFKDANWVSYRLTELLSMDDVMRQRLLEIDDAVERLHMILGLFTDRVI